MSDRVQRITHNLQAVQDRVAQAANRSGRAADAITVVAVTKYVGAEIIEELVAAGARHLAESRPQELWQKQAALGQRPGVDWHLIGHLQRNKARRTVACGALIHSVDSVRLMRTLQKEAANLESVCKVLLEVNISGDEAKDGFREHDLVPALDAAGQCPNMRVCGLMGMAGLLGGEEKARRDFEYLRELRDRLTDSCPANVSLRDLSMGMSRDFEIAIECGATIVRVGSALYEGILQREP